MFGKEKKELTEDKLDVLNAIYNLVRNGTITFGALEPVTKDFYYSTLIKESIKKQKEEIKQKCFDAKKSQIISYKNDLDRIIQERDKCNNYIAELRTELEEAKNKRDQPAYEDRIRNLLWWIFNNEESLKALEDEIQNKEALLKRAEEELLNN